MNLRIKRRRFGQLIIASATSAAVTNLASKTVAQQPQLIIYGVRLASAKQTEQDLANVTPGIVIVPSDVGTDKEFENIVSPASVVENIPTVTEIANKAIFTQPRERLTGCTTLLDGTIVISSVASSKKGDISRLLFVNDRSFKFKKGLKTSGHKKKNSTVESLLATKDGRLLSVISHNGGLPPFDLVVIDPKTGKVTSGDKVALPELPPGQRLSNLVQLANGAIYATTLDREGATNLVQLDLDNKSIITGRGKIIGVSPLSLSNKTLGSDLLDLAASPDGQLFALADPNRKQTNSLFIVDPKTGEMKLLRKISVDKITFALS